MARMTKMGGTRVEHESAKPNPRASLGQGGRFAALKNKLASEPGVRNPGALAASIGRKKLGAAKFEELAENGRADNENAE